MCSIIQLKVLCERAQEGPSNTLLELVPTRPFNTALQHGASTCRSNTALQHTAPARPLQHAAPARPLQHARSNTAAPACPSTFPFCFFFKLTFILEYQSLFT